MVRSLQVRRVDVLPGNVISGGSGPSFKTNACFVSATTRPVQRHRDALGMFLNADRMGVTMSAHGSPFRRDEIAPYALWSFFLISQANQRMLMMEKKYMRRERFTTNFSGQYETEGSRSDSRRFRDIGRRGVLTGP